MVQLSRPFQAVIAALALFVLVWFVVLHRPGDESSGSSGSSSSAPSTPRATAHSASPGTTSRVRVTRTAATSRTATGAHAGAQPAHVTRSQSVRATRSRAHVTRSTTSVKDPAHGTTRSHADRAPRPGAARTHTASPAVHASAPGAVRHAAQPDPQAPAAGGTAPKAPAMQATVAAELKQGKVALLLFWSSQASADRAFHQQVEDVAHKLGRSVAVHAAAADQVGSFGSITRDVQVYQTPTLLIVNPRGQVTTVTGYTDAYALEQTIREARG